MPIQSFSPTTNYARLTTLAYPQVTATTNAVNAAVTFTPAEILSGLVLRDTLSTARADLFPTAAALCAAINGCTANTSFRTLIKNTSAGAGTSTLTTNTGLTLSGAMTVAQATIKELLFVCTNANAGSEAWTIYSLGPAAAF